MNSKFSRKNLEKNELIRIQNIYKKPKSNIGEKSSFLYKSNDKTSVILNRKLFAEKHVNQNSVNKNNIIQNDHKFDLNSSINLKSLVNIEKQHNRNITHLNINNITNINETNINYNNMINNGQNSHKNISFNLIPQIPTEKYHNTTNLDNKNANDQQFDKIFLLNLNRQVPMTEKNHNEQKTDKNISLNINLQGMPEEYYNTNIDYIAKIFVNKFSSNLNRPISIEQQASIEKDNDNNIIDRIKQKFNKIIHVYQEKYKSNKYPTGFGDFIRSCFFIIQFCSKLNFQYEIIINHPISKYLKNFSSRNYNNLNNYAEMFSDSNWDKCIYDEQSYIKKFMLQKDTFNNFINHLHSLHVINNSVFSYNILFPYDDITSENRRLMRNLFEPTHEINDKVNQILLDLHFMENRYCILHIRSGDSYLINENEEFSTGYFEIIKNEIIQFLDNNNKNMNILLIADNNIVKSRLNKIFPNIKFLLYNITHVGEGIKLEEDKVKNTMTDFFLMSKSSFIFSLTSYPHGSGFSYWCANIFGIPYKCKFIDIK